MRSANQQVEETTETSECRAGVHDKVRREDDGLAIRN